MAENAIPIPLDAWDPLVQTDDPGVLVAAQKREITNILKSYTGYYDLFAELLQNALDAVERRTHDEGTGYAPRIWITIDLKNDLVSVTDNGCGTNLAQFKQFLKPNLSFKAGITRGSKGVGATYLGYGFNHLEIATRQSGTRCTAGFF
jgi:nitrogen fixation/metabolism regulation signal transduction histidine kinase